MDINNKINKIVEKTYVVCPSCQGSGFLYLHEENAVPFMHKNEINLPLINHDYQRKTKAAVKEYQNSLEKLHLPPVAKRCLENSKEANFQDLSLIMENFLEEAKEMESPSEILKQALQKLKGDNSDDNILALRNILCLSQCHRKLVESTMPTVYRKLSSLLQNTRPQIVSIAAQLSSQFFVTMHYAQRPEFDELGTVILQKTAHMNKQVKESTNKALDAMIACIPFPRCISVLTTSQAAGHKSPEVRATVARLFDSLVKVIGEENLLNLPHLRNARRMIFLTLSHFLVDGNQDTRLTSRRLIKNLLSHHEFESCFYQDIDLKMFEKIEKDLIALKYE